MAYIQALRGIKECGTKRAHKVLFPKSSFRTGRNTVFEMFKDSALILDAIRHRIAAYQRHLELRPKASKLYQKIIIWLVARVGAKISPENLQYRSDKTLGTVWTGYIVNQAGVKINLPFQ